MGDLSMTANQDRLPWQTPTLESHGSLEQLTKSVGNAGPGDGVFSDANS